jgi:hypothetical protein
VNKPIDVHMVDSHNQKRIAEKSAHPSFGTGEVTADKAAQYANNHKKTVICDKHHYYHCLLMIICILSSFICCNLTCTKARMG